MKLKEFNPKNLTFTPKELPNGIVVNVKYLNEPFEFQIPKGTISGISENGITLNIKNSEFFRIIKEIEKYFGNHFTIPVESVSTVFIKFQMSGNRPQFKVYTDQGQFNYHNLKINQEVICLIVIDKLWITDTLSYCFNLKELKII
jgi:hypothetical protein